MAAFANVVQHVLIPRMPISEPLKRQPATADVAEQAVIVTAVRLRSEYDKLERNKRLVVEEHHGGKGKRQATSSEHPPQRKLPAAVVQAPAVKTHKVR